MGWAAEELSLDSWQRQEIPPQLYKASGLSLVSTQPFYSMGTKACFLQGKVAGFWSQSFTQIKCHMYLHSMYRDLFVICVCLMSLGFICLAVSTGQVMRWLDKYEWVSGGMVVEYVFILLFCFNLWIDKDMRNESWGIKEEASFHSIQHFLYYWMHVGCVVSGFCCSVNEIFTPLVFYNTWNPRKPKMSCRLCCSCVCFSSEIKGEAIVTCEGTGDAGKKNTTDILVQGLPWKAGCFSQLRNFLLLLNPEILLPCLQEPTIGPHSWAILMQPISLFFWEQI